jgi:predicted nucleotidyltransferase
MNRQMLTHVSFLVTIAPIMVTEHKDRSLSSVLFGRTRRAILSLLYGHPERSYYLREIVRKTGFGLGAVQRDLAQLTAVGIIERSASGRQVYFRANTESPVFTDLKNLIVKTAGAAGAMREALLPLRDRISVAFVYGSVARGEETPQSDVDVLIVGEVSFGEVVKALQSTQERLEREVNPSVYPAEEFRRKVDERHYFILEVLSSPKLFVLGDEHELERLAGKRVATETQA